MDKRLSQIKPYLYFLEDDIDLDDLSDIQFNDILKALKKEKRIKTKKDKEHFQKELIKQINYFNSLVKDINVTLCKINKYNQVLGNTSLFKDCDYYD
jgi:hypothetical protein